MKKMKLALIMVLAMSLAIPMAAYAAADVSVTGDLTFRSAFGQNEDEDWALMGNWRTRANLDLRAGNDTVSAYARYRLRHANFLNFGENNFGTNDAFMDLLDAYVDVQGPVLSGVSESTLRIGRFDDEINSWIGDLGRREAARAQFDLGPASVHAYHGWLNADQRLMGISASATVDIVELSGAYLAFRDNDPAAIAAGQDANADYAVAATVTPSEGVSVTAEYANNGERKQTNGTVWGDSAGAWKISGELATIDNLTLRASTWSTDDDFRPVYRKYAVKESLLMDRRWTDDASRGGADWGDFYMATGFSVGASTVQGGLPIDVDFRSGTIFEDNLPVQLELGNPALGAPAKVSLGAPEYASYYGKAMNVLGVGTTISEIDLGLTYTSIEDHDAVTDLSASRVLPVAALGGDVTLKGNVRLQGDDTNFGADATWAAPNGLTLGLHYANYDRVLDWGHNNSEDNLSEGVNLGVPGEADGFGVTAGYQLNF